MIFSKYSFAFILMISLVNTAVASGGIVTPRSKACEATTVANTIRQSMAYDFGCGLFKSGFAEEVCKKGNPYPSTEDFWKNCVECVLDDSCDENWGDPHLVTRDGLRYDFQAQGDYALIVGDNLEVQARYKRRSKSVSLLDGVAIKAGNNIIVIEKNSESIIVNNKSIKMSSGDWYEIDSPNFYIQKIGKGVILNLEGILTLSTTERKLTIDLNDKYAGKTQGLQGDGDGNPANDLRTKNGEPVDVTDPSSLYGQFMLDWRREGKASLFPTPYQYNGDPNSISKEVIKLSDIDPTKRKEAAEKCMEAGLVAGAGLDECIYDLVMTGDDSFINDALLIADRLKSTISAAALTTKDISIFSLQNEVSVSLNTPEKGAGRLERATNLDRYTLTVPVGEQQNILVSKPCNPDTTLKALIRQNGIIIGENPLLCKKPLRLPEGNIEVDIYSTVGDLLEYNFDLVDDALNNIKREIKVTINAPDKAVAGTTINVSWDISSKDHDARIIIQPSDEKPDFNTRIYIRTKGRFNKDLRLPSIAGDYVLRWYNRKDRKILAERAITLKAAEVSITASDEVTAGTDIEISWQASKGLDSFINIQSANEKPSYDARPYIYTKKKSSEYLRMPSAAGKYVLRWYNRNDRKMLAERAITLKSVDISITAPDEVTAGTEIEITWQAPKGLDSFINIQLADEKPSYDARPYIYTKKKSSEYMRMPSTAGDYVLRWYNRNDKKMLAERAIKLKDVDVSISAPDEVTAGTEIEITWQAPKGLDSFINIQLADEKPSYDTRPYIYTKKKSSEYLRMPSSAGNYVLRWYNRNDKKMLAERAITLMDADISIIVPDEAIAGTSIGISWQAPKGLDSFINIQPADKKPNYGAKPYIYTKKKSSENMKMPEVAGEYIFRWFNRNDRKMLAERNIKLLPKE